MNDAKSFVENYSRTGRAAIAFASNGEVGVNLRDDGRQFRHEVAEVFIDDPSIASDELIRDLYDAETRFSKAAFSVHHRFVCALATELLSRGGTANVTHYLECVWRGQDAYLSSQCVQLAEDDARHALKIIDDRIVRSGPDVPAYYLQIRDNIARQLPTHEN